MKQLFAIALLCCALFALAATAHGQEIRAKPGDTLTVETRGKTDEATVLGVIQPAEPPPAVEPVVSFECVPCVTTFRKRNDVPDLAQIVRESKAAAERSAQTTKAEALASAEREIRSARTQLILELADIFDVPSKGD